MAQGRKLNGEQNRYFLIKIVFGEAGESFAVSRIRISLGWTSIGGMSVRIEIKQVHVSELVCSSILDSSVESSLKWIVVMLTAFGHIDNDIRAGGRKFNNAVNDRRVEIERKVFGMSDTFGFLMTCDGHCRRRMASLMQVRMRMSNADALMRLLRPR